MSYTGTSITTASYNAIRLKIYQVISDPTLVTSYGFTGYLSTPATQNDVVSADQWDQLRYDINRAIIHQTGFDVLTPFAVAGTLINGSMAAQLNAYADQAVSNSTSVESGQLASDSTNASSYRATVWGSTISHVVTHVWNSPANVRQFFNLGGRITAALSYNNSGGSADDNIWVGILGLANSLLSTSVYNLTDFLAGGAQTIATAANGDNVLTVTMIPSGSQIRTEVVLTASTPGAVINLDVSSVVTYYYSRGDAGPIPYGIPAPRPQVTTVTDLESGGELIPIPTTRILNYTPSPLSTFAFLAGNPSATQTVTITNVGNADTTVTLIYHGSVTQNIFGYFTYSEALPWVISPGGTRTFTVYFTGVNNNTGAIVPSGIYNNSIVLLNDSDAGNLTIPAVVNITGAIFNASASPSSWISSTNSLVPRSQQFTINPISGTVRSYTAVFASPATASARGFSITLGSSGPIVTHAPSGNGVFAAIMNLSITGHPANSLVENTVYQTISLQSTVTAPLSYKLGSWISPLSNYNAVVGASYDVIDGDRYLTLGFGAGADGLKALDGGGRVSVNDLGISADSKFQSGVALYRSTLIPKGFDSNWPQFLKDYGVWVRSNNTAPYANMTRSYRFSAPTAGSYTWSFTVDDNGYFNIDNVLVGDLRSGRVWPRVYTGTTYLTAGQHTIEFTFNNRYTNTPAAIAIKLANSGGTVIWSTLDAVRATNPYFGWSEVYRIPLPSVGTGSARTYYSRNYYIKDGGMVNGEPWGRFFGSGAAVRSMFTVVDDGSGNLSININDKTNNTSLESEERTMLMANYAAYYYINSSPNQRISQFPAENASQTKFFLGFLKNGTVNTVLKPIPSLDLNPPSTGCPAPWHTILLADGSVIAAGSLEVGMMLRTQHEFSLEWGDFAITAVETLQQDSIQIVFDHCEFTCSKSHKFHVTDTIWKQAYQLQVGDVIAGHEVLSFSDTGFIDVVKITVDDAHTYVCENMLSHNSKPQPDPGIGCPAPWHKILLADGRLINAGDLRVGMWVRTQHEHTLAWGEFAVTAVEIMEQNRMEILFDHCRFVCSDSHKFHVADDVWKQAYQLVPGDVIDGHQVLEVADIEVGDVIKITVDDAHTYICEGMLSHNTKAIGNSYDM